MRGDPMTGKATPPPPDLSAVKDALIRHGLVRLVQLADTRTPAGRRALLAAYQLVKDDAGP